MIQVLFVLGYVLCFPLIWKDSQSEDAVGLGMGVVVIVGVIIMAIEIFVIVKVMKKIITYIREKRKCYRRLKTDSSVTSRAKP
jgi:hypothetical protein